MTQALRRDGWLLALNALAALLGAWAVWGFYRAPSFRDRSSAEDVGEGVAWLLRFWAQAVCAFVLDFLWAVTRGSSLRLYKGTLAVIAGGWAIFFLGTWTALHFGRVG